MCDRLRHWLEFWSRSNQTRTRLWTVQSLSDELDTEKYDRKQSNMPHPAPPHVKSINE